MLHTVEIYFLLLMIYATLGWIMEVVLKWRQYHKFINRGFLIGPYCPIYGCGGVLITLLLSRYTEDPLVLFIFAMLLCAFLEYNTSLLMEKIFHARWWDYSTTQFNLNGRICLNTMIPFGILGLLIMYVSNPFFLNLFESLSDMSLHILSGGLAILVGIDGMVSIMVLSKIKRDNDSLDKDNTEEMVAKVKEAILSHGWAYRRLLNAYPTMRYIRVIIKKNVHKAKNKAEQQQEKIKRKTEEEIARLKAEYDYRVESVKQRAEEQLKRFKKRE